jgi:predicted transcriptional regulator
MVTDDLMKTKSAHKLTPQDRKIVDVFADLGMPKNLAKTLMFVSNVKECRSADIERGANLRQPEVSVAMQELTRLGWVSKRNQKKEGKGRPIYIYRLESQIEDIITYFEKEKLQQILSIKEDLTELKNLLKTRDQPSDDE